MIEASQTGPGPVSVSAAKPLCGGSATHQDDTPGVVQARPGELADLETAPLVIHARVHALADM